MSGIEAAPTNPPVANEGPQPDAIVMDQARKRQLCAAVAAGAVRADLGFLRAQLGQPSGLPSQDGSAREVMTADEVAAFLGVDRNTVYDYAARGVIPHKRLGKRMLFWRAALVAWLDGNSIAPSSKAS